MEGGFGVGKGEGDLIRRLLGPISMLCNRLAKIVSELCMHVCVRKRYGKRENSKQVDR